MKLNIVILLLASLTFLQCKSQTQEQGSKQEKTSDTPRYTNPDDPIQGEDHFFSGHSTNESEFGPTSISRNIIQDKTGAYWFATWEGIVRYDGKTFTNFTNQEELKRYRVFSLLEDSKGHIWIGTLGAGVYKYDGEEFVHYTSADGLADNKIGCFLEDKDGAIWIGCMDGLSKFSNNAFENFSLGDEEIDGDINSMIQTKDGDIWFATRGKLFSFDGQTFTEVKNEEGESFYNTRSLMLSKNGSIWLGGNSGLWSYSGQKFKKYAPEFIGYIFEDSKQNIWLAKSNPSSTYSMTLIKNKVTSSPVVSLQSETILTPDGQVFGITEDSNGRIWFGLENGICRYDGQHFEYFKE